MKSALSASPTRKASAEPPTSVGGYAFPETVSFEHEPTKMFAHRAVQEHVKCLESRGSDGVPRHLPRVAGLLFGQCRAGRLVISHIEMVPNVRDTDERVLAEFESNIAPKFGDVFKNPGRGFWCEDKGVLQAIRTHAVNRRDLLGSIHSHPNWHEIGPQNERFQELSEHPTRMDEYLFQQSGWPVNAIWYVRSTGGDMTHRVAAWRPGPTKCDRLILELPPETGNELSVTW